MLQAYDLVCNYATNPLGVDDAVPVFSWKAEYQSAFRIIVSDSEIIMNECRGNTWDSGIIASDASQGIKWAGPDLETAKKYFWKVKIWSTAGEEGPWSETAWFETGLLHGFDWEGKWIQAPRRNLPEMESMPAPFFRKPFSLDREVVSARIYICGLGYFELYVNGCKAGAAVLNPAFSVFDKTCLYCTYDITGMLKSDENVIGVILGNGMYCMIYKNSWDYDKAPWRDNPKMLVQANILYADGTDERIYSGSDWKTAFGPITSDNLFMGESYDARLEIPGWCTAGYDCGAWMNAVVCRAPGGRLASMQMEPICKHEEFQPLKMWETHPGEWVYDMGRSIAGWVKLKAQGQRGAVVELKYAEKLLENGEIDNSNINKHVQCNEFQYDTYTLKGEGLETWEPRFTYHGFQYVQMTGYPGAPDLSTLTACRVHTDLKTGGGFSCSNELVNKIQAAARASTLNNWHGIPTDCPHREKNGWTGDALISCEQTLMNFMPINAYKKWLGDIIDCQRPSGQLPGIAPTGGWGYNWGSGPAWDSALVLIPWNIYLYIGDKTVLEQCWDAIRKYIGFMDRMSEDGTVDFGLGDWCPPGRECDGAKTPTAVSDTWFYYVDALTASKIAAILEKHNEAEYFAAHAEEIRRVFLKRFVDGETGDVTGSCQTSYALALQYGITRGELAGKVFGKLVDEVERCNRHIDCGILGAKYALQALADGGRADLAWAIVSQRDYPSWGHWIEQGATTLWEMWNGDYSRNHHMFSSVSEFFYKSIAGINPDESAPGFKRIFFKPNPVPSLDWAEGWHESPYGTIRIRWDKADKGIYMKLKVPNGAKATLVLPDGYSAAGAGERGKTNEAVVEFPSGDYSLSASPA